MDNIVRYSPLLIGGDKVLRHWTFKGPAVNYSVSIAAGRRFAARIFS